MCRSSIQSRENIPLRLLATIVLFSGAVGRFRHDGGEKNVCYSAPCQNGGECIDLTTAAGEKRFQCACMDGYEGLTCQKRINPCATDPCKNEGQCVPRPGNAYHCICGKGFHGRHCENKKSRNQCESKPCGPNGVCIPTNDEYICECQSGYSGPRCRQKVASIEEENANVAVPLAVIPESPYSALVIALLVIVITLVVILLMVGIHCVRVINRLSNLKAAQERRKSAGEDAGDCPGVVETSNRMCVDFFCCRDRKKYLGEVTGVIVPVDEFKTMMKNQQGPSEYDKATPMTNFHGDDNGDQFDDYDKGGKKSLSHIKSRSRHSTELSLSHHDQQKREISGHSFAHDDNHIGSHHWPDEADNRLSIAHSTAHNHQEHGATENIPGITRSSMLNHATHPRQGSISPTPKAIEYHLPRHSHSDGIVMNASFENVAKNAPSHHTKSTGDLYKRYKSEPAISREHSNSLKLINSAPKLLESTLTHSESPHAQYNSSVSPTIVMSPKHSIQIQAANLAQHQAISKPELEKRMSSLLQRQSELSQAAAELTRHSQAPSQYYRSTDFTFPVDDNQYRISHSMVPIDANVLPSPPKMNRNTKNPIVGGSSRVSSAVPRVTINRPSNFQRRSSNLKQFEIKNSLGGRLPSHNRSSMATKRRTNEKSRESRLPDIPSDDNTSVDETYFNNNSECDDVSLDYSSPFEYSEASPHHKGELPGRRNKLNANSISHNVRKQRMRTESNLRDDELEESEEEYEPQVEKSHLRNQSKRDLQRERKSRSYPRSENRNSRDTPLQPGNRHKISNKKIITNKRENAKYMLLPQRSDSDEDFNENDNINVYTPQHEKTQSLRNIMRYNQNITGDDDEDNGNDEDSGDESTERVRQQRPTMDDGYVSTGRMSESDVGGRDRDPLSFQQRLVNQSNQVYHIRPRINGEEMSVRGINRFNHSHSANTTDEEDQQDRRIFRQPGQPLVQKRIVNTSYGTENRKRGMNPPQPSSVVRYDSERNGNSLKKGDGNGELPGGEKKKMKRGEIPSTYKKSISRLRMKRKEGIVNVATESSTPKLKGILKKKQNISSGVNTNSQPKR